MPALDSKLVIACLLTFKVRSNKIFLHFITYLLRCSCNKDFSSVPQYDFYNLECQYYDN